MAALDWLGPAVLAALTLAGGVFAWWRAREPLRRARQRRRENAEIARDVGLAAGGDAAALGRLNDRLRVWRAEGD